MRKNKILSVIGGLAAFIFTSCDGIFDVDYYTFLPEDSEEVRGGYVLI